MNRPNKSEILKANGVCDFTFRVFRSVKNSCKAPDHLYIKVGSICYIQIFVSNIFSYLVSAVLLINKITENVPHAVQKLLDTKMLHTKRLLLHLISIK